MKDRRRILSAVAAVTAGLVAALLPGIPADAVATPAAGVQIRLAHDNLCLNVQGASAADSAKIVQYTCTTDPAVTNDKFKLVPKGNAEYWIQGVGSGKCLNVQGGSQANGALIIQYTCGNDLNTLWKINVPNGQANARFVSASSNRCLNLPNAQIANNVQLIQYACTATGAANEYFYLPPATSAVTTHRAFTTGQPVSVVQDGANGPHNMRPFYYSYVGTDHRVRMITDSNPDPYSTSPSDYTNFATGTADYGYTGRTEAAVLADGRVQVIYHDAGTGDTMIADEQGSATGDYPTYNDIGGAFDGQPAVGPLVPNSTLAVYAIINGALWYAPQQANDPQVPYGTWRTLGGNGLTGTPVITASSTSARITALTTSGTLQTATLAGNTLSDWTDLGGSGLNGTPSIVVGPSNITSIFVRSNDGTVVLKKQNADGTFPTAWTSIPGLTTAGSPSAVLDSTPGRIAIFARDAGNVIYIAYETAQNAGTYLDWFPVSDPTSDPNALAASDPTAFAYNVPSGASFGVAYMSATLGTPYLYTFAPATASAASRPQADGSRNVLQPKLHRLGALTPSQTTSPVSP